MIFRGPETDKKQMDFLRPIHNMPISSIAGPEMRGEHLKLLAEFDKNKTVLHLANHIKSPSNDHELTNLIKIETFYKGVASFQKNMKYLNSKKQNNLTSCIYLSNWN